MFARELYKLKKVRPDLLTCRLILTKGSNFLCRANAKRKSFHKNGSFYYLLRRNKPCLFMKTVVENNLPIWNNCMDTPFIQELWTGKLPENKI